MCGKCSKLRREALLRNAAAGREGEREEVSADLDAPGHFAGEESTVVLVCPPLAEGPGGAWAARESDATVVCVQKWADSRLQLADTIRELDLARAKVVGVVLFG